MTLPATDAPINFAFTAPHPRKFFLNIPVHDLERSMTFFSKLGFVFNRQFTDTTAAAMLIGEDAFCMLLTIPKFTEFTKRPLGDPTTSTTSLFTFSVDSRAAVDEVTDAALANGGAHAADPQDQGFMYQRSFYDPDGHQWEVFWMDPSVVKQ